jgi:hypothetical protein
LNCPKRRDIEEARFEEMTCHGVAMCELKDFVDDSMVGGDMYLKNKIINDRKHFNEKKPFKEKRDKLEDFFKTNLEVMLENKKTIMTVEERRSMNAIDRKCFKELIYEMDPYEWTLVKLSNGKTKAVIVKESSEYKNWRIDEKGLGISEQVIIKRQAIIDSFEIIRGFPKKDGNIVHLQKNST